MMQVGGVTESTASATLATQTAQSRLMVDYHAFLQLLIAQMKNQDPTQPIDSTEYIAQLAAFSNVEQAVQTNAKLDSLMEAISLAQADGIIGRTITSVDGSITGEVTAIRIISGGAIAVLADGREVMLGPGVIVA
jgi:flagellar basal-body rod modification protein FlgD